MSGSLTVVGTGVRALTQLTTEASAVIRGCDVVHYVVPDPLSAQLLHWQAKEARDLADLYGEEVERRETYAAMVERIVGDVLAGRDVCAVFYGHPGVFVDPSHQAIDRVRELGLPARMMPGVSAADALYADLGIDPGTDGIAQYTATDFVLRPRMIDPTTPLLLWQIGAVGETKGATTAATGHVHLVVAALLRHYPADHPLVLYAASAQPTGEATIAVVALDELAAAPISREATLLVPPLGVAAVDPEVAAEMGIEVSTDHARPGRCRVERFRGNVPSFHAGQGEHLGVTPVEPVR